MVVPMFNSERWIGETLGNVFSQDFREMEVIVIDDGSTDRSAEIVRQQFPTVRLVRIERGGPSRARNEGTRLASGEFIQYLDSDDLLGKGKISAQMEALERESADVAYGDWIKLEPLAGGGYQEGEEIHTQIQGRPEIAMLDDFWCPPAAYLFRRSVVEKAGYWPEDFPVIEDAHFALNCVFHGARFVYCPGIMAYYRVHRKGSLSTNNAKTFRKYCLANVSRAEEWWRGHGGIDVEREKVLLRTYDWIARASFSEDREVFHKACDAIEKLQPGYAARHSLVWFCVSKTVGFPAACRLGWLWRRIRGLVVRKGVSEGST